MAFSLAVNFQPAGAATPAGYVADTGLTYGDRGNGFFYGWNASNTTAARDRNNSSSIDQRYDTLTHTQLFGARTWEAAVPNGQYQVTLVAGDPSYFDSVYRYNIETTTVLSGTPTSGTRFYTGSGTVTVSDGKLTLSNGAGASNNKVCFIQINSLDGGAPAAVPGIIQAEDFGNGGAGISYSDTTSANLGGQYRNTAVDIVSSSEGGYAIGYTRPNEWLKYSVNVQSSGGYNLELRVASMTGGRFQTSIDGQLTGNVMTLPNTGGWQSWKTISYPALNLTAGTHTLGLHFGEQLSGSGDLGNVNWLRLTPGTNPALPTVSVSASDASASEPGSNTGKFTFTRSGSTASSLTIGYTVSGSATNGQDYNTLGGSITIPAGASSATLTVTPKDDSAVEGSENVRVTISNAAAYQVGTSNASVTIADNDAPAAGDWPTSWTTVGDMPKPRWEATSIVQDGKLWVFGGWMAAASTGTQQVDVFNLTTRTWSTLKNYAPVPHTHSMAAADPANHAIYFAGGLMGGYPGVPSNGVWKFNTQTLQWSTLPSLPAVRAGGGLALVNNRLHYFGGILADHDTNTDSHIVLDLGNPAAGWKNAPAMPVGRDHFSTVVLGGQIYVMGGEIGHDSLHDQQDLLHRYHPATGIWTRLADLPTPKSHAESAVFVTARGTIIMSGGQIDPQKPTDEVVEYDPATNKWTVIGKLPIPLQGATVQMIDADEVVVTAGSHTIGPEATTWIGRM